jgi:ABC-2 type transport system ATP-binding protein
MTFGLEDVTVCYGARVALDRVTVRAHAGAVTCVIGGDGAGKSTVTRTLVGLTAVRAGTVARPGRGDVGYLPAGSGIYGDLSVDENLSFAASAYGMSPREADVRTGVLLERTGLSDVRRRLAGQLSGGMRQKLGVVKAMLPRPALLVLDEPTTGVDPVSRADLWSLIARAAAEGAAVVLTTTYVNEAERAGEVVLLDSGRVLASGAPERIVAAAPGTIRRRAEPRADERSRAWRRGREWRVWSPEEAVDSAELVVPDLTDAVIVATLRAEPASTDVPAHR